jgi:2-oxoglutarate ferredoxin oxidoreductase subunit alpha
MNAKRIRKLAPLKGRRDLFEECGNPFASIALVSWGSAAGAAREAMQQVLDEGFDVKLLVPRLLFPVAEAVYEDFFASVRVGLVVEQSQQGQLFHLLRMFVNVPRGVSPLARSGANPFSPEEIADRLREVAVAAARARVPELEPQLD